MTIFIFWTVIAVAIGILLASLVLAWFSIHPPRLRFQNRFLSNGDSVQDISFVSADGTKLAGCWMPSAQRKGAVILCHGMFSDRNFMHRWSHWLLDAGYSVLVFDFRALGKSGGRQCTIGLHEMHDVVAAVDWVSQNDSSHNGKIAVIGFSMGAVAAILSAALDERIRVMVAHGAFTNLPHAIHMRCKRHFGILFWPIARLTILIGKRWYPGEFTEVDCCSIVSRISPRRTLFINGRWDPIVWPENAALLYAESFEPKKLLILPNSGHNYPKFADESAYREGILETLQLGFQDLSLA